MRSASITPREAEPGAAGPSPLFSQAPEQAGTGHPLLRSKGVSLSLPDVLAVGSTTSQRRLPEATFTPTAAGLRAPEVALPAPQLDLQSMFSSALSSLLAAGLQQVSQLPFPVQTGHGSQEQLSSQPHTSHR